MDKNQVYGDNFLTRKTRMERMGITYPHYAGISYRLIPCLSVVWKTYPPEMWTTVRHFSLCGQCGKLIHSFCGKRWYRNAQLKVANQKNLII